MRGIERAERDREKERDRERERGCVSRVENKQWWY